MPTKMEDRLAAALQAAGVSLDRDGLEMVAGMLEDDPSCMHASNKTQFTDLLEMSAIEHDAAEAAAGHFYGLKAGKPKANAVATPVAPVRARPVADRKSAKSLRKIAKQRRAQRSEEKPREKRPTSLASLVAEKRGEDPAEVESNEEPSEVSKPVPLPPAPAPLAAPIKLSDMEVSTGNAAFSTNMGLDNMLATAQATKKNTHIDRGEGGKDHTQTKKHERRKQKELQQQQQRSVREAEAKEIEKAELLTLSEGLDEEANGGKRGACAGAVDVHLEGFNLENKKDSGEDLLQNATVTLSAGRCYALIGRNGGLRYAVYHAALCCISCCAMLYIMPPALPLYSCCPRFLCTHAARASTVLMLPALPLYSCRPRVLCTHAARASSVLMLPALPLYS
jgi:hypothetical protein